MTEINLDLVTLTAPINSGLILNAFYTALLLKKLSGVEITDEIREQTLEEVVGEWARVSAQLDKTLPRTPIGAFRSP